MDSGEEIAYNFDVLPDSLRIVPQFSAKYWNEELRRYFEAYPRPKAREILREYWDYASERYSSKN